MNKITSIAGLALSIFVVAMILTGCATTKPTVPGQLLHCADQPPAPVEGTQRDVGLYVIDLAAAGDDCRTKLGSVRIILEPKL